MAGGTFVAQNKIRPGAYVNYVAIKNASAIPASDSGVVFLKDSQVVPIWGTGLVEITREDLLRGGITKKLGFTDADDEYYVFREILRNARSVLLRLTGGVAAKGATDKIKAELPGTAGNSIIVSYANGVVSTSFRGKLVDSQQATTFADFVSVGFIKFVGAADTTMASVLGTPVTLAGGTAVALDDPEPVDQWNVLLADKADSTLITMIKNLRDNEGFKIQAVVGAGTTAPNYEGIIRLKNEYYIEEAPSASLGRAYVAGLASASGPAQSNTYHRLPSDAVLTTVLSHSDTETAVQEGFMVLTLRRTGDAVIEQDINSLTTFSTNKKYEFSKNRVLRVLDGIATRVSNVFEEQYIGKVNNNEMGRSLLEGAIVKILRELQDLEAIQNFDADNDIDVIAGESIDSVVVNVYVQPLDAMEKLYMTIYVN
jgi:hypothetical protein